MYDFVCKLYYFSGIRLCLIKEIRWSRLAPPGWALDTHKHTRQSISLTAIRRIIYGNHLPSTVFFLLCSNEENKKKVENSSFFGPFPVFVNTFCKRRRSPLCTHIYCTSGVLFFFRGTLCIIVARDYTRRASMYLTI